MFTDVLLNAQILEAEVKTMTTVSQMPMDGKSKMEVLHGD
jgi:hypothetical protein